MDDARVRDEVRLEGEERPRDEARHGAAPAAHGAGDDEDEHEEERGDGSARGAEQALRRKRRAEKANGRGCSAVRIENGSSMCGGRAPAARTANPDRSFTSGGCSRFAL